MAASSAVSFSSISPAGNLQTCAQTSYMEHKWMHEFVHWLLIVQFNWFMVSTFIETQKCMCACVCVCVYHLLDTVGLHRRSILNAENHVILSIVSVLDPCQNFNTVTITSSRRSLTTVPLLWIRITRQRNHKQPNKQLDILNQFPANGYPSPINRSINKSIVMITDRSHNKQQHAYSFDTELISVVQLCQSEPLLGMDLFAAHVTCLLLHFFLFSFDVDEFVLCSLELQSREEFSVFWSAIFVVGNNTEESHTNKPQHTNKHTIETAPYHLTPAPLSTE